MGPPRHLALVDALVRGSDAECKPWPVPFADGIPMLQAMRGQRVVVLASGDPFWFGAGGTLARHFGPSEWRAFPGASCFSLAAAELGWRLEATACLGLHAAPLAQVLVPLARGRPVIATLRDGAAVAELVGLLQETGFGESTVHVLEALGGPRQRCWQVRPETAWPADVAHPVCAAVFPDGPVWGLVAGGPDSLYLNDGQITKRPVRALTLSALAPRPGEHLWDIGGGSGSIAIEWLLSDPGLRATCVEKDPARAARIRDNAARLGVPRLKVVEGTAPGALDGLDHPQAVFVGGGLSEPLLDALAGLGGTRVVANAVTLESEALLTRAQARFGGALLRIELAEAQPVGPRLGWKARYPIVQWSAVL